MPSDVSLSSLAHAYIAAKRKVLAAGYGADLVWQMNRQFTELTERCFMEESAWVILSCGMKESVVRRVFGRIGKCFLGWRSSASISASADHCFRSAVRVFNHPKKIEAIIEVARQIHATGFDRILAQIRVNPIGAVRQFPFIGPVTSYHLAKNIGVRVAKPDRHLIRIAAACGYDNVQALCGAISSYVGDTVDVVDTVLWRYASISPGYLCHFAHALHTRSRAS